MAYLIAKGDYPETYRVLAVSPTKELAEKWVHKLRTQAPADGLGFPYEYHVESVPTLDEGHESEVFLRGMVEGLIRHK